MCAKRSLLHLTLHSQLLHLLLRNYMHDLESYSVVQIRETCWSALWLLWRHASVSFYGEGGCRDEWCPSNSVLALSQKETRVYIGTDKSAVFQASSLHVIIVHHAVVVASGYVQQCSAWLNLPESKHHLHPVSEMMEYPAQEDNFLLFADVSVLGLVGGLERSAKFCSADAVSSPNYEENSLPEVHHPSSVACLLTCWVKKREVVYLTDTDFFKML